MTLPNRHINILYIGIGPHNGGPVVSLVQLIENIDKSIYSPFVFSLSLPHKETFIKLNNIKGVKIIEKPIWINNWLESSHNVSKRSFWHKLKLPGRILRLFYNSWQISKIIIKNDIDLVHTNIELVLEGAIAAKLTKRPHIWHIRAPIGPNGAVKHFLGQRFCCTIISILSNRVIVNSIATKESIQLYINHIKLKLIYNGISPDHFESKLSGISLRYLLNISENKKIIASIGYLSKLKGGNEFINIALNTCKYIDDIVFVWIGPSRERTDDAFCNEIFEIIEANYLGDKILFTGERNDINLLLRDIDLLLHPMVNGSWSRVVLEAMAASKPVIAIEENLTSEFIINGETGLLARNEYDAIDLIKDLIFNQDLLEQMGKNGRKRVLSSFTNDITAIKTMELYNKIFQYRMDEKDIV